VTVEEVVEDADVADADIPEEGVAGPTGTVDLCPAVGEVVLAVSLVGLVSLLSSWN
jgi:hypothetical protein